MIDIFLNLFKKSSIGVICFFILNALLISAIFAGGGIEVLMVVFVLYIVSVFVAFSPLGEWILCFFAGAKKMTRVDMQQKIQPLFQVVYMSAKGQNAYSN